MAQIRLTVKSNFDQAGREIRNLGNLTEAETKRLERYQKQFSSSAADEFIRRNQRAAAAVQATHGPLDGAIAKQRGLQTRIQSAIRNGMDPQDEALQKLQHEYEQANRQVEVHTKAQRFNETAVRNATIAIAAMTAAAAALAARGGRAFMEYSRELANVNTMIDMTAEEFGVLDRELTALSQEFAIQKTELSAGVYQALSAGAADLGEALDVVESAAILGRGALIDNAAAVDIVTTAMNAYGEAAGSTSDVIDTYFTIIREGKINGEQLSQTIGQSISLFAAAKIPLVELGAGIATLTKSGVSASEATTQLNAVVNAFIRPSQALSGELANLGFSSGAAFLEAEGLAGAIEFLTTAGDGTIDSLSEMVPNIRALRGTLAAASQDGMVFNQTLEAFAQQSGNAEEALRRQTEGFAADAFTMEQSQVILQNFSIALGQMLVPQVARVANWLNEWMTDQDRVNRTLNAAIPIIAGAVAALATFVVVMRIQAAIERFGTAMAALNAIMLQNPAILIALAIGAVIATIVLLIRNWDQVVVFVSSTVEKLKVRVENFGGRLRVGWISAMAAVRIAVIQLATTILDRLLGAVQRFLDLAGRMPFVGHLFENLSSNVDDLRGGLAQAREEAIAQSRAVVDAARAEQEARNVAAQSNIDAINAERDARLAALREQQAANEAEISGITDEVNNPGAGARGAGANGLAGDAAALSERLSVLNNVEAIAQQERLATYDQFLMARMEQEGVYGEQRVGFLQSELARIGELEGLSHVERIDAERATQSAITQIQNEQAAARRQAAQHTLTSTQGLLSSLIRISENAGKRSRALVILQRGLAIAQIGIDTARGVMKVIADYGIPWGFGPAAVVTAAGAAQALAVATEPIPTAETGTRFVVPESRSSRLDSVAVMASPGEQVEVTPRGESGKLIVNVELDGRMIMETVQDYIDSGELTFTTNNLRSA